MSFFLVKGTKFKIRETHRKLRKQSLFYFDRQLEYNTI